MKRILLIGNSPLPNDNVKKRPSEGLRTWQFVRALERLGVSREPELGQAAGVMGAGEQVGQIDFRLVTIAMDDCYEEEGSGSASVGASKEFNKKTDRGDHGDQGYFHHQISENNPQLLKILQAIIDEHVPHVIVGVNLEVCNLISRLKFDCVFWADMAGWTMAKAQIDAYKTRNDRKLKAYSRLEENVLERADFVSVASEAQKFAVLGELAMMRKLGAYEFDREFVVTIENGLEDFESDRIEKIVREVRHAPSADRAWSAGTFEQVEDTSLHYFREVGGDSFSGADVPANAFVILWLGSYSAWVDEETLFKGVEAAMGVIAEEGGDAGTTSGAASGGRRGDGRESALGRERGREPRRIYFVSTGGLSEGRHGEEDMSEWGGRGGSRGRAGSSGGDSGGWGGGSSDGSSNGANKTYLNFKEMVGLSRFKDQFKFLGWVPVKHIPYLYREADIGLNVDRRCLDTLTGSRNRLLEMMKFGLPVVTTLGTELSYGMQSFGACIGVRSGSVEGVRDAILELYRVPARRKDYGTKGRRFVEQHYSYEHVMRPFVKWVERLEVEDGVLAGGVSEADRIGEEGESASRTHRSMDRASSVAGNVARGMARGMARGSKIILNSALKSAKKLFEKGERI